MKDRDELVRLMARIRCCQNGPCIADDQNDAYQSSGYKCTAHLYHAEAEKTLDALEAAGCTVVPNEATEEMVAAMISWINNDGLHGLPSALNAAITASPYRRKP